MRKLALVPPHVPLAVAAEAAKRHGFELRTVRHEGRLRIAMVSARKQDSDDAAEADGVPGEGLDAAAGGEEPRR